MSFLLLFVCFLVGYYLIPKRFQIHLLAAGSLAFCGLTGGAPMFFSLLAATASTWYGAVRMEDAVSKRQKTWWFYGVLLINAGALAVCKYLNFFVYTGRFAGELMDKEIFLQEFSFIVPLGISFYTLQVLGYLIDVARGTCQAQRNLIRYAAFSCYFPQLLTGPINRYGEMADSLYEEKNFDYKRVVFGLQRMGWGLFKKLVIAERMAVVVDTIYGDYHTYQGCYVIFATICFACQLYADFSGAIDLAAGASEILGIRISENFNTPFFSRSLSEFWRRWHITLGSWMRDYVFYPVLKSDLFVRIGEWSKGRLGKKRGKKVPTYLGMVILWFTVGLWHGGSWKYIVGSGLLHCFYIAGGQILDPLFQKMIAWIHVNTECFSYHLFQSLRTGFLVCTGFVFFRAESFRTALKIFKASFYPNIWIFTDGSLLKLGLDTPDFIIGGVALGILFLVSVQQQKLRTQGSGVREMLAKQNLVFRWSIYYMLIFSIIVFGFYGPGYDVSGFIYQNF